MKELHAAVAYGGVFVMSLVIVINATVLYENHPGIATAMYCVALALILIALALNALS